MRKLGGLGGFGMIMLVVVLAIVLLVAARQWQALAPTAIQVTTDPDEAYAVDDHGDPEAGQAIRSGQLPDLNEMRQNTSAHADRLEEALEDIE